MVKKLSWLALIALVLTFAGGCGAAANGHNGNNNHITLNVYNWGEYIDDEVMDVNAVFTEETGIKINYKTFESNESMYTILASGAAEYDVIFPSDYMVGKMIREGMLAELNLDNIPNFQYIGDDYKNLSFDPQNRYSVPYTWGTVAIFYNTQYVDEEDLEQGWDILWNEKYADKIYMFDNAQDSFGIALKKCGFSMNTTDRGELSKAYEALLQQKPLVQGYFMDQVFQKMTNEEGWLAPYYAGDGAIMIDGDDGNENISSFIPHQGTNYFFDCMCVPITSKQKDIAEQYINFLCRTDVAKANAEYICYSTPQTEALKLLDPEVANNPMYYPPQEVMDKTEVFITLDDDTLKFRKKLWIKLKTTKVKDIKQKR